VVDVDVVADISHTWAGDLVVKLESAEGSLATLVSVAGYDEGADNGAISPPGSPSSGELDGPITFDDDAATSSELMGSGVETGETICIDGPPCEFYSSGFPETEYNLDTLVGEDPLGDWTLCVGDVLLLYTGLLNNWQLEITCSSGSFMVDSGNVGLLIVDDGYDGTLESMACSTVTVP
jgi:subtilisin-like proprotein convertase family protein